MRRTAPSALPAAAAAVLLGAFVWMALSVSADHGPTADEGLHLTAGLSYWRTGDFRLQPENGLLPQAWAGLALRLRGMRFPSLDQEPWRIADVAEMGHQFLFESGNSPAAVLLTGRAMIAILGAACGVLVFLWTRSLFGAAGALIATALYAFCPGILAHAGLATSDMAATLGFLAATLASWRLLHRVSPGRVAAAGIAGGLLCLCKFSSPLIVPMVAVMAAARAARGSALPLRLGGRALRLRGPRAAGALAAAFAAAAALAIAVIWAGYGFRFSAIAPGADPASRLNQSWPAVLLETPPPGDYPPADRAALQPGAVQGAIRIARDLHLLPEAWLFGFAHTLRFSLWRPAFLLGHYRTTGWLLFFPVAFALKTPFTLFAALILAAAAAARARPQFARGRWRLAYRLAPLAAFFCVYWAFALSSHLDIGHRHLLPTYPVLFILCGAAALAVRNRLDAAVVGALLAVHAAVSLAARPAYLAYFNPLLGGPSRAYLHLVDSSLDWGQDLPGLSRWLAANARPNEPVFLSYFGSDEPSREGIVATRIGDSYFDLRARRVLPPMTGGLYCIGATMFQQVYTEVRHGWTAENERRYGALTAWQLRTDLSHLDGVPGPDGRTVDRARAIALLGQLEQLRFGRLCRGLRDRTPDAEIGYSILIFRLTEGEVRQFLYGPANPDPGDRP